MAEMVGRDEIALVESNRVPFRVWRNLQISMLEGGSTQPMTLQRSS